MLEKKSVKGTDELRGRSIDELNLLVMDNNVYIYLEGRRMSSVTEMLLVNTIGFWGRRLPAYSNRHWTFGILE